MNDETAPAAAESVPLAHVPAAIESASGHMVKPDAQGARLVARAVGQPGRSVFAQARAVLVKAATSEWERGTGFLFLPVFMALGALANFGLEGEPAFWPLLAIAGALGFLALRLRERPALFAIVMAAAMTATGMVAAKLETMRASTQMNGSAVTTAITGRVVRVEHQASGRVRLTLELLATERPTLRYAPQRVRLTARRAPDGLIPGETVQGLARLMPPFGPIQPGSYDFSFENYFDRLGATGFFMGDPERAEVAADPPRLLGERVERARLALAERVRNAIGGAEGEIAATLIAGVRAGIPEDIAEALRRTGLAHILAISGLHMALVAATVMTSMRLGFALFPAWAARRPVRKYAAAVALCVCGFYLVLSGMAVAAQRSFIMLAVMLVALLFDRQALTLRNLAIAAIIVLSVAPHEVIGPSFQMSFAATAVLIGSYAAWTDYRRRSDRKERGKVPNSLLSRIGRKALLFAAGLAATSLLAGLATTLYGVHHFHRVSPHALWVNLLAMPIVSLVVMPMALFSVLSMPFGLDGIFLWVMGEGIRLVNAIAVWFSDRSPLDAVGTIPTASVAMLSAALVIAMLTTTWLRLLSLPIAVVGFALLADRQLPDILISEDARMIAIRQPDGSLALNRTRPNGFTVRNWMMAAGTQTWHRPESAETDGADMFVRAASKAGHFVCADETCLARLPASSFDPSETRATIAQVADAASAAPLCQDAVLIVITDATARDPCGRNDGPIVLTSRDLALAGAAQIYLQPLRGWRPFVADARAAAQNSDGSPGHRIEFAIPRPFRPWHEHRRFSREARGLAPIERRR